MTDIAQLVIDVRSDTAVVGAANLDKVKAASAGAQAEVSKVTGQTKSMATSMKSSAGPLRQVGLNLSQVAQQGAVTGNYFQALTIQAADIGLAFGTIGIAAGAAISVLGPFAAQLLAGASNTTTFDDALQDLEVVMTSLEAPIDTLNLSLDDLIQNYGTAAERVREFALAQAELNASRAEQALRDQLSITMDVVDSFTTATDAGRAYRNTLLRIEDAFGVTNSQARVLEDSLGALSAAGTFEDQQAQLSGILDLLDQMDVSLSDVPPELQRALSEMITFSNEVDRAAVLMERLKGAAAGVSVGVPLFDQGFEGSGLLPPEVRDAPRRASGGRGGGGISEAERERNELLREAERVIDATRTAQEEYNEEFNRLNVLLQGGYINQETYNRALADAGERLEEATGQLNDFAGEVSDELAGAFRAGVEGADALGSAVDAATSIFLDSAQDFFQRTVADPLSGSITDFLGGIVGAPPAAASATLGSQVKAAAAGAVQVKVQNYANAGVDVQQDASGGIDIILKAVAQDIAQGGVVGTSFNKTYQASPALVRR